MSFDGGSRKEFDDKEGGGESSITEGQEETVQDKSGGRGADVSSVVELDRVSVIGCDWTVRVREKLRASPVGATVKVGSGGEAGREETRGAGSPCSAPGSAATWPPVV